jgi:F-type H+-transporting ATPase subunit b
MGIEILGIKLESILLHLINLVALLVILYFVLYKRVKAFMKRRSDEYTAREDDIAARQRQADEMKEEYAGLMNKANNEIARISEEAVVTAEIQGKALIEEAKKNAKTIIEKANNDILLEKAKMKAEFKNEVADIAVDIAGKILMREIKDADTKKVLDDCLDEWSK